MIELISGLPSDVAGFRATGEITKDDYETVVFPEIDKLIERTGKIRFLLVIDTGLKNFTIGAWWEDLWLGLKNFTKWERIAIVSDSTIINRFSDVFATIVPGAESKGFDKSDFASAKAWVAADS
ncbi:STAS/SEC14 domain-containing protein [Hufsiella ginkgonis]|uniref:STAS/SEC14 domain-containing protein n=1 Tax=Hufsiella ginkgonis TaxID=2695274 RepID=A0A7K1XU50_9SPHI|nr:STAS/SEC14 domain-containing protein [Hufsiella ginkgonis]MXV14535.1 STAS/SEC14 domain-containing protein [Hufsiella ginkgonis]